MAFIGGPARAETAPPPSPPQADAQEIVTIRPDRAQGSKQGIPLFQGISGQNAGARALSMNRVVIPPGGAARAHVHKGYESAIYLLRGRVRTLYGEGLKKSVVNEAGDFLYIPAGVPHKPINLSATEPAEAIVARTDPNEQESVEHVMEPHHDPVPLD
ncbi:MAG: cupin domain-containing protein [Panacagrimonas sp.]